MAKKKTSKTPLDNQVRPFALAPPSELKTAHEELAWFFQQGDAECGIKSNYEAFLFAMVNSCSITSAEDQLLDCLDKRRSEEELLKSIRRNKTIYRKFKQLSPKDQNIIQLFHYEQQFDRSSEAHFGAGIKLAPLTKSWEKLPKQWQELQKLQFVLIHERKLIDRIKKEILELYFSVLEKYVQL